MTTLDRPVNHTGYLTFNQRQARLDEVGPGPTKADEARNLAVAAGFTVGDDGEERIASNGGHSFVVMYRPRGLRPVHGRDVLTLRFNGNKLIEGVLLFGDSRPFGSRTCRSIPTLRKALGERR